MSSTKSVHELLHVDVLLTSVTVRLFTVNLVLTLIVRWYLPVFLVIRTMGTKSCLYDACEMRACEYSNER